MAVLVAAVLWVAFEMANSGGAKLVMEARGW